VIEFVAVRCYEVCRVKVGFGYSLEDSDLHRKLLFGRDGSAVRPFNKFASQSGLGSVRTGSVSATVVLRPTSEQAIAVLDDSWRMRETVLEHPAQPLTRSPFSGSET